MDLTGFKVMYPSGMEEIVLCSDVDSVESFANTKFGSVDYKEAGVKVKVMTAKQVDNYQRGISEAEAVAAEEASPQQTLQSLAAEMEQVAAAAPAAEKAKLLDEAQQVQAMAAAAPTTVTQ